MQTPGKRQRKSSAGHERTSPTVPPQQSPLAAQPSPLAASPPGPQQPWASPQAAQEAGGSNEGTLQAVAVAGGPPPAGGEATVVGASVLFPLDCLTRALGDGVRGRGS